MNLTVREQQFLAENQSLKELVQSLLLKNAALEKRVEALEHENKLLREENRLLKQKLYGKKSEIIDCVQQGDLFYTDLIPDVSALMLPSISVTPHQRKKRGGRRPLPDAIHWQEQLYDVEPSQLVCACGCKKECISVDISKQIEIIPPQLIGIKRLRPKYSCPVCHDKPVIAPMPPTLLPKCSAGTSLLAYIVIAKFLDHLPLYRLSAQFNRLGIDISRANLTQWVLKLHDRLEFVLNRFHHHLLQCHLIQVDETPFNVKGEKHYAWVYRGENKNTENPYHLILFEHHAGRARSVLENTLGEFTGALQSDGYAVYRGNALANALLKQGCFAHARRKFFEAIKILPKEKQPETEAYWFIQQIRALYQIERSIKTLSAEQRYQQRQLKSLPILNLIQQRMQDLISSVPPSTLLGKALHYLNNEWPYLIRFIDFGELHIDNNLCEQTIRPFVLGRKNWLHAQSENGAKANCTFYSLIATAKANGIEPMQYLTWLFKELTFQPRRPGDAQLDELMPWNYLMALK